MILKAVANKNTSSIFELSSFISTVVSNLRFKKKRMNVFPIIEVTNVSITGKEQNYSVKSYFYLNEKSRAT